MPKSIEHYQQETGRAGRDGLEAECVLLYSGADVDALEVDDRERAATRPARYVEAMIRHLDDMDRYCSGAACRHRALVEYFGQPYAADDCGACDICLGDTEDVPDALVVAQKILSCVLRAASSRSASATSIGVLRGENTEKIREREHDQLTTYGLLKDTRATTLRDWIYQLIGQGFLAQTDDEYPVLHLDAALARAIMRGEAEVRLRQPIVRKKRRGAPRRARVQEATARTIASSSRQLRKWRRSEAAGARRAAVRHLQRPHPARAGPRAPSTLRRAARHLRHRRRRSWRSSGRRCSR